MQIIPINDAPNQQIKATLAAQNCLINLYQLDNTSVAANDPEITATQVLYMDVYVGLTLIIGGVVCQNENRIVRNTYLGFIGDLAFYDTMGSNDPTSPGLGTRYQLCYLELSDLNGLG
jgi:hypothetical protein